MQSGRRAASPYFSRRGTRPRLLWSLESDQFAGIVEGHDVVAQEAITDVEVVSPIVAFELRGRHDDAWRVHRKRAELDAPYFGELHLRLCHLAVTQHANPDVGCTVGQCFQMGPINELPHGHETARASGIEKRTHRFPVDEYPICK